MRKTLVRWLPWHYILDTGFGVKPIDVVKKMAALMTTLTIQKAMRKR